MKRILVAFVMFCGFASTQVHAQTTVYPLMGIANIQFFTASGAVCSTCSIYIYQAGTSTQVATYVDSSGTSLNTNPVLLNSAGRPASGGIWLTAPPVKIVGCSSSSDGANCAGADILFSVDQVTGNFGASSGSATSPFTSSSSNPATTGILRLASSDSTCWRNAANSANLCWSKDSSDRLIWAGGSLFFPEIGAPTGASGSDLLWADNSAHRWMMSNNGGSGDTVVGAATTDTLTNKTLTSPTITNPSTTGTDSGTETLGGKTLSSPTINGATVNGMTWNGPNNTINDGLSAGTGLQHIRFTSCSVTVGGFCTATQALSATFADTSYTVVCSAINTSTDAAVVMPANKMTTTFDYTITLLNGSGGPFTFEIDCILVHD